MSTKVVIKDVIGSYVYLREARENQNGEKDYSMQIILPKNHPQVEQIKKAITEVAKEHFGEKIKLERYSRISELLLFQCESEKAAADCEQV